MSSKVDEFGFGTGRIKYKDPAFRFKNVGRQYDPLPDDHPAPDYADCRVERSHRGDLDITNYVPGKEYREVWDANGNHTIDYDDGCRSVGVTGTSVFKGTQGQISTVQYASDAKIGNHSRIANGSDGNDGLKTKGGGVYTETFGDVMEYNSGIKIAGGHGGHRGSYGFGMNMTNVDVAGQNGKGGIGHGVANGSKALSWIRQEKDGRTIIQVMPQGDKNGIAVVEIMPDGAIRAETKSSVTVTADGPITMTTKQGMTLNAKNLSINAPVDIKGKLTQTGGGKIDAGDIDN